MNFEVLRGIFRVIVFRFLDFLHLLIFRSLITFHLLLNFRYVDDKISVLEFNETGIQKTLLSQNSFNFLQFFDSIFIVRLG